MKPIKYPKTKQFRDMVKDIRNSTAFIGLDEYEEPVYNYDVKMPTLPFRGTIKLHGTNASVGFNNDQGIFYQSRNNIKKDGHFEFVNILSQYQLRPLFDKIAANWDIDFNSNTAVLYGEWAGKGIQKGVAVSKLPRRFYIFALKIKPNDGESYYIENYDDLDISEYKDIMSFITEFPVYQIDINFNMPEYHVAELLEITDKVEKLCPVGSYYGVEGIGEGVVWEHFTPTGERKVFKVKGEKHSVSNVKKLNLVDIDELKSAREFAELHVNSNRVKQAIHELGLSNPSRTNTGDIIKWVKADVLSEEQATVRENNLSMNFVVKELGNLTRDIYFKLLGDGEL